MLRINTGSVSTVRTCSLIGMSSWTIHLIYLVHSNRSLLRYKFPYLRSYTGTKAPAVYSTSSIKTGCRRRRIRDKHPTQRLDYTTCITRLKEWTIFWLFHICSITPLIIHIVYCVCITIVNVEWPYLFSQFPTIVWALLRWLYKKNTGHTCLLGVYNIHVLWPISLMLLCSTYILTASILSLGIRIFLSATRAHMKRSGEHKASLREINDWIMNDTSRI